MDGDGVGEQRRVEGDFVKAVLLRVVGDDDGGQDLRDVVLGFGGQLVALVELPEIGIAGLLNRVLNVAGAVIVGGHGQVPIAQLVVEKLHVAGVGAGGFFRIEALIGVGAAGQ